MRSYMDENVIATVPYSSDNINGEIPVTRSWLLCLNVEQFLQPHLLNFRKQLVSFTKAINSEAGPYWYVCLRVERLWPWTHCNQKT
jgi:hypothetical protein